MNTIRSIAILFLVLNLNAQQGLSDTCTPPPSAVAPIVTSQVSYDAKARTYKYRYTIRNEPSAQIPLDWFGILINTAPSSSVSPTNWDPGEFTALGFMPSRFSWSTSTVAGSAGKKITGDGTLSAPTYALKPGSSLSGFELISSQPPGVVQFFAQGFTQPPSSVPTAKDDEPTPTCAGWDFHNAQLATQVTGATTGPSDPNTISVRLRAREEKGRGECSPINPKQPSGKIAVLVLSTHVFDASQIDVSSIMFGPAYVAPISSQLVQGGVGEQIGRDERIDWEQWQEQFDPNNADRKNSRPQNLLLTFDVASLDVQCHLDQAIFFRGQTKSGQKVVGAIPANVIGCGTSDQGKHGRHKVPRRWWVQESLSQQGR